MNVAFSEWSPWVTADADVAPDSGTGRWHDGNLDWTGASDRVQFSSRGSVRRLRSYELWSRVTSCQGVGRPIYRQMHPLRQRRAMRRAYETMNEAVRDRAQALWRAQGGTPTSRS